MPYRSLALLICALIAAKPLLGQNCADPAAPVAARLLVRAQTLASNTTEAYATYRDSIMHIAAVPMSDVVLATSDSICQVGKAAYGALVSPEPAHTVQVYVFQIGSGWLVVDPLQFNGTWRIGILFDSTWTRKSTGNIGM